MHCYCNSWSRSGELARMQIKKFVSIKNIGRFQDARANGDVTLGKYNLIFAENGRGKTTLCSILRSLQNGDGAIIAGRKTLGSPNEPEANILVNQNDSARFLNGAWNQTHNHIAIFDGTYVTENVYSGDAVSTDQKRNLYRVIIGEQGVRLARQIEQIDGQINDKNTEIRVAKAALDAHSPEGISTDQFIALEADENIDAKIEAKEKELRAANEVDKIRNGPTLAQINTPQLPAGLEALLAQSLDGVSSDAEEKLKNHIASHAMGDRGEAWVSQGLGYLTGDECPFCEQSTKGIEIVDAYKAYFSDAYKTHCQAIADKKAEISAVFSERNVTAIDQGFAKNAEAVTFWNEYTKIEGVVFADRETASELTRQLREQILAFFEKKLSRPLDVVGLDQEFNALLAQYNDLVTAVEVFNQSIDAANVVIQNQKQAATVADSATIKRELTALKAVRTRHTQQVIDAVAQYANKNNEKGTLGNNKAALRQQLDTHTAQVIQHYGTAINRYLKAFNAGFSITTPTHDYRGRTPSSSYQIVINDVEVELGDSSTPIDQPSFKNTLSAGDRSTLALALFFAEIEQHPHLSDLVVVLDDPFTSMDSFRRNNTAYQIKKWGEQCAQIVLLSHDPAFLKLVWDKLAPADRKSLQLARVGERNTTVVEWDIDEACKERFKADIAVLSQYHSSNDGQARDAVKKIRPVIEGYCRNISAATFADSDMVGEMIAKIRIAGNGNPLFTLIDELDEINEYCRPFHHADNSAVPMDETELHGYVQRTLKIVGSLQ